MNQKRTQYLNDFVEECCGIIHSSSTEANRAVSYLTNTRELSVEDIGFFRIGYCSVGFILPEQIRRFGHELLADKVNRDLKRCIVGKIVLPVYSEFRECVGIATRNPDTESNSTWWNLPAPFYKSLHLFGLHIARKTMFEKNKVYVVEGYMDAITLYLHGIKNVVAVMGTKLSLRQCALIARYCNNVCMCFDEDANQSGQKGIERSVSILHRYGFCENISVIKGMPVKEDPDSFVRKYGADDFLQLERNLSIDQIVAICKSVDESAQNRRAKPYAS